MKVGHLASSLYISALPPSGWLPPWMADSAPRFKTLLSSDHSLLAMLTFPATRLIAQYTLYTYQGKFNMSHMTQNNHIKWY